jgi:hypothetical protein
MRPALAILFFALTIACTVHAQSPNDTVSSAPAQSARSKVGKNAAGGPKAPVTVSE